MSTKIRNGYRLTGPARDPFDLTAALREALQPVYRVSLTRLLARKACLLLDTWNHVQPPEPTTAAPVSVAWSEIRDGQREIWRSGYRDPEVDFQCELSVLRDPSDLDGPRYGLLFTERSEYTAAFEALPGVEAWSYWNDADGPDEVPEEEWDARREVWDRVLPWDAVPASIGVSWKLLGMYDAFRPTREEVLAAVPSAEQRARNLAAGNVDVVLPQLRLVTGEDLYSLWATAHSATTTT